MRPDMSRALLDALTTEGVLLSVPADDKSRLWSIPASHIHVRRTTDPNPASLRCGVCSTVFPAPSEVVGQSDGAPCMRVTCPGNFSPTTLESDYYYDI